VRTRDGDEDDSGTADATVPTKVAVVTFDHKFQTDQNVANASAVATFQSDDGWMATKTVELNDSSRTIDQAEQSQSFSHSPENGSYTGSVGDSRQAAYRAAYKISLKTSEAPMDANAKISAQTDWGFRIPNAPSYVPLGQ
jgi:hypothetical protein